MSAPPTLIPEQRFTDPRRLHMCRARVGQVPRGAHERPLVQRCRALSGPKSSLLLARTPRAVPARVSAASRASPAILNPARAWLASRAGAHSGCTCSSATRDVSEGTGGLYHRPEDRPQASRSCSPRCATGVSFPLDLVPMALQLHVEGALVEGRGGAGRCRSSRPAAGPSPPVRGPSACSRARSAAAIWRCAMLACAMSE